MQDNISVILASILAIIIVVLFPIYNIATRQDNVSKNIVVSATTEFVDTVRNKGYIEKKDYDNFLTKISYTGNSYEVELEVYNPVYIENEKEEHEEKYEIDYTEDVLKGMEQLENSVVREEVYALQEGDKIYARVKNTNITQAQVLLDRLFGGKITERIVVNYGGIVYSNEWAKAGTSNLANTNISISRPMNYEEKEFKYEMITNVYDQYTGEYTTIYGLAVKLNDEISKGDQIKFRLTYKDIKWLLDKEGNGISNNIGDRNKREDIVKEYIRTEGFEVNDIEVQEIKREENGKTGTYNYQYMITLSAISYNFANNVYLDGMLQIEGGSAETRLGTIGLLNSEEFIIIYKDKRAETGLVGPMKMTGEIIPHEDNILNLYDKKKKETINLSGIPVRINETSDIKFILTYSDIVGIYNETGVRISTREAREEYIKNKIKIPNNWKVEEIIVTEKYYEKSTEISVYNAEYEIVLKGISYELDNELFIKTNIEIESGSAKIKGGERLKTIKSKEFIILDERYLPTIEFSEPMNFKGQLFGDIAHYLNHEEGYPYNYRYRKIVDTEVYEYIQNSEEKIKKVEGPVVTLTRVGDSRSYRHNGDGPSVLVESDTLLNTIKANYRDNFTFKVIFNRITGFIDDNGRALSNSIDRQKHIVKYVGIDGVVAEANVTENSYISNGNGTFNAEYTITIKNTEYDTIRDSFKRGKIKIKEGCAQTFNYSTIEAVSAPFVITYLETWKPYTSGLYFKDSATGRHLSGATFNSKILIGFYTRFFYAKNIRAVYKVVGKNSISWFESEMFEPR